MPKFSLQVTPAVKKETGWEVTAQAEVLYGNNPPDPPEEVVFDVNGEVFERTETNPESGIARSVMILQSGGYIVTAIRSRAGERDRDSRRTRTFSIREERKLTENEKKLVEVKAQTELVKAERELEKAKQEEIPKPKKPTGDEKKTAELETKTARFKASKKLMEAEQELKQVEPPKPKSRLKIIHVYRRLSRLEVVLQRTGKDGKPEDGEISVLDFEQAGVVFGDTPGDFPFRKKKWGIVTVFLPYFEYSRRVKFFLPDSDDPNAEVFVDVPARVVKKPERVKGPSVFQRMREAYSEERDKAKAPVFEIRHRQPLIFLTPQGGQDGR